MGALATQLNRLARVERQAVTEAGAKHFRETLYRRADTQIKHLDHVGDGLRLVGHMGDGAVGGFSAGFMHPILGWDHVIAMVAVGLWGAFLGAPALWVLPVVFPLVMVMPGLSSLLLVGVNG